MKCRTLKSSPNDCLLKRRLYCEEHSSLFYTLYVYSSMKAFHAAYREHHPHDQQLQRTCIACCTVADGSRSWRRGEVGAVYFARRALTVQIIAHEAAHAALGWWQRVGLEIALPKRGKASSAEERFCYVLDSLVGQIYWRCQQAGLI